VLPILHLDGAQFALRPLMEEPGIE
jgi:hypothetical protein